MTIPSPCSAPTTADGARVRAFVPGAESVEAIARDGERSRTLARPASRRLLRGAARDPRPLPAARPGAATTPGRSTTRTPTARCSAPWTTGSSLEGTHARLFDRLGAHAIEHEGTAGVHFAVWAPNARRVSVVGDFNAWDGRRHVMRRRVDIGVWEIFVPGLGNGTLYKYEIRRRRAASCCRSRPIPWASARSCGPRPPPSCATRPPSRGPTRPGWRERAARDPRAPRCPSTRCTRARGGAAMATAGSTGTSWPTRCRPTWRTWASRTSS